MNDALTLCGEALRDKLDAWLTRGESFGFAVSLVEKDAQALLIGWEYHKHYHRQPVEILTDPAQIELYEARFEAGWWDVHRWTGPRTVQGALDCAWEIINRLILAGTS